MKLVPNNWFVSWWHKPWKSSHYSQSADKSLLIWAVWLHTSPALCFLSIHTHTHPLRLVLMIMQLSLIGSAGVSVCQRLGCRTIGDFPRRSRTIYSTIKQKVDNLSHASIEILKCAYHEKLLNASTDQACVNWGSFIWSLESLFKSKQQKALQTTVWTLTRRPPSLQRSLNGVCLKLLKTKSRTTSAAGRLRADCVLWHPNRREKERDSECMTRSMLFKWTSSGLEVTGSVFLEPKQKSRIGVFLSQKCVPEAT